MRVPFPTDQCSSIMPSGFKKCYCFVADGAWFCTWCLFRICDVCLWYGGLEDHDYGEAEGGRAFCPVCKDAGSRQVLTFLDEYTAKTMAGQRETDYESMRKKKNKKKKKPAE